MTDKATARAVASTFQRQRPCRPLRRSQSLNRLPKLDEITPPTVEQAPVTAGRRRSLCPGPQHSTGCAVKPSEPAPSGWIPSKGRVERTSCRSGGFPEELVGHGAKEGVDVVYCIHSVQPGLLLTVTHSCMLPTFAPHWTGRRSSA